MAEPAIRALELTKHFGSLVALDHLTLDVAEGEVFGFLGPNGAGKSTTMRMILGLDRPTSGSVTVNGHRYAASPAPLREVGAQVVALARAEDLPGHGDAIIARLPELG